MPRGWMGPTGQAVRARQSLQEGRGRIMPQTCAPKQLALKVKEPLRHQRKRTWEGTSWALVPKIQEVCSDVVLRPLRLPAFIPTSRKRS